MRTFESPIILAAVNPIESATLTCSCGSCQVIELTVQNNTPEANQATLTAPADAFPVCHTPMQLNIRDGCGCWSTMVDVPTCEPPSIKGTYHATEGLNEIFATCPVEC